MNRALRQLQKQCYSLLTDSGDCLSIDNEAGSAVLPGQDTDHDVAPQHLNEDEECQAGYIAIVPGTAQQHACGQGCRAGILHGARAAGLQIWRAGAAGERWCSRPACRRLRVKERCQTVPGCDPMCSVVSAQEAMQRTASPRTHCKLTFVYDKCHLNEVVQQSCSRHRRTEAPPVHDVVPGSHGDDLEDGDHRLDDVVEACGILQDPCDCRGAVSCLKLLQGTGCLSRRVGSRQSPPSPCDCRGVAPGSSSMAAQAADTHTKEGHDSKCPS